MNRKLALRLFSAAVWVLALANGVVAAEKIPEPVSSGPAAVDQPPRLIKQVQPHYPLEMRRAGLTGQVLVEFVVDKNGNVQNPYTIQSSNPWFERAALTAIVDWKFAPGLKAGRPVNTGRVRQLISFQMTEGVTEGGLWQVSKGNNHEKLPVEFHWVEAPVPVHTTFTVYPFELLQARTKGKASIGYIVGTDGQVIRADVTEATTPEMGLAMLAMIETWKFEPARWADGTPCMSMLGMTQKFDPSGEGYVPVSSTAKEILRDLAKRPEKIFKFDDLDQPPKPRSCRSPVFPSTLRRAGAPGTAEIEFFIDENGDAQLPRIISASAPEFGYAAAQAVATWRFDSPLKAGKKVVTKVRIPVNFTLK